MDKTWTVYVHINKINSKKYIGITSRDPVKRWGLNGNGYKQQMFWNAIQKYGWDNFSHQIIATGLTHEEAEQMEIYLIEKYESNITKHGYNVTKGGDGLIGVVSMGMLGKHHTEEAKALISEAKKGKPRPDMTGENNCRYGVENSPAVKAKIKLLVAKPVLQLDNNFQILNEYPSLVDASKESGIHINRIRNCCNYNPSHFLPYIWVFKNEYPISKDNMKALVTKYYMYGIQRLDLNGSLIQEYNSIREAENEFGFCGHKITKACKEHSIYEGSYWQHFDYSIHDPNTLRRFYDV